MNQANVKRLIDNTADPMWLVDRSMHLLACNRSFAIRFYHRYHVRVSPGLPLLDFLPADERRAWKKRFLRVVAGESCVVEDRYRTAGRDRLFEISIKPVKDGKGVCVGATCVAHEITDRYRAEQGTQQLALRLQALLNSAVSLNSSIREPDEIFRETMELLSASIAFDTGTVQLLDGESLVVVETRGFPEEQREKVLTLRFPLDARFPNQAVVRSKQALSVVDIREKYPHFLSEEGEFESGHVRSWLGVPLIEEGEVVGMFTMDRKVIHPFSRDDIQVATALAHNAAVAINNAGLYQRLLNANQRQEILLRELHHRVKNNMQLVSSLLSLHSEYLGEDAQQVFRSLKTRILTLSAVHEALYQSDQLDRVDLVAYMHQVIREIEAAYNSGDSRIRFEMVTPAAFDCSLNQAVPFGLILGELVLNAVKHAFPERESGEVRVELFSSEPERTILVVSDNGIGFSQSKSLAASPRAASFGMTLVDSLAGQLNGTLERGVTENGGVRWALSFPVG